MAEHRGDYHELNRPFRTPSQCRSRHTIQHLSCALGIGGEIKRQMHNPFVADAGRDDAGELNALPRSPG
ncbi:MAG: hypothetical protein ABSB42_11150 [Tepidisphaeraceae bacterium]|jgi:hypothetical protein